jgi:hypothetical protein
VPKRMPAHAGNACCSPKLCEVVYRARVTMLQASLHAIHFTHILNFGEGQL